jgi:hypothetical protein
MKGSAPMRQMVKKVRPRTTKTRLSPSPSPRMSPTSSHRELTRHRHHLNIALFTINTHHPDIFITTQLSHQRKASKSVAPFSQQRDFPFASPPVVAVAETLSCPSQAKPPSSSFACAFSHVRIWWLRTVMASVTRAFHLTPPYPY